MLLQLYKRKNITVLFYFVIVLFCNAEKKKVINDQESLQNLKAADSVQDDDNTSQFSKLFAYNKIPSSPMMVLKDP